MTPPICKYVDCHLQVYTWEGCTVELAAESAPIDDVLESV